MGGSNEMDPHRPVGFLGRMVQVPRLLGHFDAAALDEAAIVIVIVGTIKLCTACDEFYGSFQVCLEGHSSKTHPNL